MKPLFSKTFALSAALLLALLFGVAISQESPLGALLQRPKEESKLVIVPGHFLRSWDPITLFFPKRQGKAGPEDLPERLVKLRPEHPGAWTWLDARTLQFRPADPWPPLARFNVRAGGRSQELETLMRPPLRSWPRDGSQGLGPVEQISLSFADPIAPEALLEMSQIELRPLPGLGDGKLQRLGHDEYSIKALQRSSPKARAEYVLRFKRAIPLGQHVSLRLLLARSAPQDAVAEINFSTATPFRITHIGCPDRSWPVSPSGSLYSPDEAQSCGEGEERAIYVDFSAVPGALGPVEARQLLRFEPAVGEIETELRGSRLVVKADFKAKQVYRVSLKPSPLLDEKGRGLEMSGVSAASLWFPKRHSFLRWSSSQGIVELHGPKRVPLKGRGASRVDLRVHRVDPLDRDLWPFPSTSVELDESRRPPGPGERPEPWESSNPIPRSALRERLRALGSPGLSKLVELPLGVEGEGARFGLDLGPQLREVWGESPGHYLIGIRPLFKGSNRSWIRLQVTDLALTTLEEPGAVQFMVSSLHTGKAISGAEVYVEGEFSQGGRSEWTQLFKGRTDSRGGLRWADPGVTQGVRKRVRRIFVRKGQDLLVLDPAEGPEVFSDGHWGEVYWDWLQRTIRDLSAPLERPATKLHIFSERPIYRPEHKVQIKGWLRERYQGGLKPIRGKGKVVVTGPGGSKWVLPVELDELGGFHTIFQEEEAPTGIYELAFVREGERRLYHGHATFRIEAYVLPRFELKLHSKENVPLDQPFQVGLSASYYAGGEVVGRPIRWRVTQLPYTWSPEEIYEGFHYSSDGRYSGLERFESTPALSRAGITDLHGSARLSLDPSLEPTAQPRSYFVEATVTGADEQTVSVSQKIYALPPFVLGMKLPRYLKEALEINPEILVAGPDGKLLVGQELKVRLLHRAWHSHLRAADFSQGQARYVTDIVDNLIAEQSLKSAAEPIKLSLPIKRAGVYVVELSAQDRLGRTQVISLDLYAGGTGAISWSKPEAGIFKLSGDKPRYAPGENAKIIIQSPFQKAEALLVVEDPKGNQYRWLPIRKGKGEISLPIQRRWAPGILAHVILMRGRIQDRASTARSALDLGKPETLASTLKLKVSPVSHSLKLSMEHSKRALPGSSLALSLHVKDEKGEGIEGAQVTLWLVDQAVLALAKEARLDPLPDFLSEHQKRLRMRDTRNLSFGRIPYAEMPGGDGGGEDEENLLDKATIRRKFEPVPYYEPNLRSDKNGQIRVKIQLPDNLTRFMVRAKAASPDRFGVGRSKIEVRLPLLVQPALPRFLRPGDRFEAGAVGRVVEGEGGVGSMEIRAEGLLFEGKQRRALEWPRRAAHRESFLASVLNPGLSPEGRLSRNSVQVQVGVERKADAAKDAFSVELPLRDDRHERILRRFISLAPGESLVLPALLEPVRPGSVHRRLILSEHQGIPRMAAALDLLQRSPSGNMEQRLSQARAYMALGKLRDSLGLRGQERLIDQAVRETLEYLPTVLDDGGLVAYWPGSRGYVSLSAWALLFVIEAKESGYPVDEALKNRLMRSCRQALRSDLGRFIDGESWYERAAALHALAKAGQLDEGYFSELSRKSPWLGHEGRARVLLAATEGGLGKTPTALELATQLSRGVTTRLHQGKEIYAGLQGGCAHSPLIPPGEIRALSEMTRALSFARPRDERLPIMEEAILRLGGEDGWGSSNANAAALFALSERLQNLKGSSSELKVDDKILKLSPESPVLALDLKEPTKAHTLQRLSGEVSLQGLLISRYMPAKQGALQRTQRSGFVLSREARRVKDAQKLSWAEEGGEQINLQLGDLIEEHLQLINPEDRHHVVISLPLAAGMEPLNPDLDTAPAEARTEGSLTLAPDFMLQMDDRIEWHYLSLPKGSYDFYIRSRATHIGRFNQPPALVKMSYQPALRAQSAGAWLKVSP